jgi:O-antigen ligase
MAAWGSLQGSPALWAACLAFTACAWFATGRSAPGITALALAVWAFVGWALAHASFVTLAYNSTGIFDPLIVLAGFSVGRALEPRARGRVYAVLAAGATGLALWSLAQVALGADRGHAHFATPNTLATVLNLVLAPALVYIAAGAPGRTLTLVATLLVAGVCVTLSRGGAVALLGGMTVAAFLLRREPLRRMNVLRCAGVILAGIVLAAAVITAGTLSRSGQSEHVASAYLSFAARLELYNLAWTALQDRWFLGIGYLGFRHVLEAGRAQVPSYGLEVITDFVHNDYLQAWLETGIPGLALFGLVAAAPFLLWATRKPQPDGEARRGQIAILAAIATMVIHAAGDFPFYMTICLLLFGLLLGAYDRSLAAPAQIALRWRGQAGRLTLMVVGAGLITLAGRPALSDAAVHYGAWRLSQGDGQSAAFGFELARRLQWRDWRYHRIVGEFWLDQAVQTRNLSHVRLADKAFAAGIAASPFEPGNYVGRALTHIRFAQLLAAPAAPDTIRAWADRALAAAPVSPSVRQKHAEIMRALESK